MTTNNKPADVPRHWKPLLQITTNDFAPMRREVLQDAMNHYGIDEDTARAMLAKEHARCTYYVNDLYQCSANPIEDNKFFCMQICIRRRDGGMIWDFRHFQQIKNEIAGPEAEAVQQFPGESRLVDTSNKWHLWVLRVVHPHMVVPVGWQSRDVQYAPNRNVPGMRQRPL
jgi:hypothetical protein